MYKCAYGPGLMAKSGISLIRLLLRMNTWNTNKTIQCKPGKLSFAFTWEASFSGSGLDMNSPLKSFLCTVCSKRFKTDYDRAAHQRDVLCEPMDSKFMKPFQCKVCCKRFKTDNGLKSHMTNPSERHHRRGNFFQFVILLRTRKCRVCFIKPSLVCSLQTLTASGPFAFLSNEQCWVLPQSSGLIDLNCFQNSKETYL